MRSPISPRSAVNVARVDRLQDLVRFLEHEPAQRLERLLAIPRTASGTAQVRHDVDQALERRSGRGGRRRGGDAWSRARSGDAKIGDARCGS